MNVKKIAAAVGLTFALSAGMAHSVSLLAFEDADIDFILKPGDLTTPVTAGPMTAGDIFVSVFEIPTYTKGGANAMPAGKELTGIAVIELLNTPTTTADILTFSPYAGGMDAILTASGLAPIAGTLGDAGDGAMIAMFMNGAPGAGIDRDLELSAAINGGATNCTSLSDCMEQATLGDLFQVDGFYGDPDEAWRAFANPLFGAGAFDYGTVLTTGNDRGVATFNFALSTAFHAGGEIGYQDIFSQAYCGTPGPIADGCAQLVGQGPLTGGAGLSNGAIAHSDLDASKYDIPEPSIAFLLGAGLLGMGARLSKRKA